MIRPIVFNVRWFRRHFQRGLSLLELLVSTTLLMLIMVMGTTIFSNIQSHLRLAEKESRVQQYARDAMNKMSRELRQTVGRVKSGALSAAEPTDIYFVVPHVNADGSATGYDLVRYWFADDVDKPGSNIKSLYRAIKSNGNSAAFDTTAFTNNRTRMIREAAAQNPGHDSFFKLDPLKEPCAIQILIRVAVYR